MALIAEFISACKTAKTVNGYVKLFLGLINDKIDKALVENAKAEFIAAKDQFDAADRMESSSNESTSILAGISSLISAFYKYEAYLDTKKKVFIFFEEDQLDIFDKRMVTEQMTLISSMIAVGYCKVDKGKQNPEMWIDRSLSAFDKFKEYHLQVYAKCKCQIVYFGPERDAAGFLESTQEEIEEDWRMYYAESDRIDEERGKLKEALNEKLNEK